MNPRYHLLPTLLLLGACDAGPIAWQDATAAPASTDSLAVSMNRAVSASQIALAKELSAQFKNVCVQTARVVWEGAPGTFATWWSVRPDSGADIVVSRFTGRSWSTPVKLDTTDVSNTGCSRPAPAIAADGDYLHIVYAMRAKEGPGIFLSHSMDAGRIWHSPVAVVYGERPGLASVAAKGNFVVVAFEDPNTTPTRISVAVSTTMAHLFDFRSPVSSPDIAASRPWVATDGKKVTLLWMAADSSREFTRRGTVTRPVP